MVQWLEREREGERGDENGDGRLVQRVRRH